MNKEEIEQFIKDYYPVPYWCRMHPFSHFDGMGGCWGISSGLMLEKGEPYCHDCEYYKDYQPKPKGVEPDEDKLQDAQEMQAEMRRKE